MVEALSIYVKGIVQGVGFRPFVYREAKKHLINGWVLNATDGVHIHAEAEADLLDSFVISLSENAPAAAQVSEIDMKEVPIEGFSSFEIRFSDDAEVEATTLVSPDLATCADCAAELFDPNDRRYRYPFINCTNCGPRFTIIDGLPYDRAQTSMHDFPMCPTCKKEYDDPLDRRFHAQPNACFTCGPQVYFAELADDMLVKRPDQEGTLKQGVSSYAGVSLLWGDSRQASDEVFLRAVTALKAGKILAVKGLGGFHLVCDATNEQALARLRERKRRKSKPFAVMLPDLASVEAYCELNDEERALLTGSKHPIVLLRKRAGAQFAAGLADNLPELGVMLPYTPVQHILLHDFAGMLVMTSGNLHNEPIVVRDEEAFFSLAGIADAIVGNSRGIRSRYDDSVVRVIRAGSAGDTLQVIRRARGFAPLPFELSGGETVTQPSIFACGPEQKATFCITRPGEAFVSQHLGDMEDAKTFDAWLEAKSLYERLFDIQSDVVVCDKHPEYLSAKWAHSATQTLPVREVQHHHAHIAAIMGENKLTDAVCGFAFDGTGFGEDGAIWGGEVLLANRQTFERFANFAYFPLPGATAAVKHPLRAAYGALWACDLLEHPFAVSRLSRLGEEQALYAQMIERGLNAPMTSSVGRLFDAVSALLDICPEPGYEGEAAILLEAAAWKYLGEHAGMPLATLIKDECYRIELMKNTATAHSSALDTSVLVLDPKPLLQAVLDDAQAGINVGLIALRFHEAFVELLVLLSRLVRSAFEISTFVLSGGVFMNRYLIERSVEVLEADGCTVALSHELPPNDGSISYGQAVVTLAQLSASEAG